MNYSEALRKAAAFCSKSEHCISDLEAKYEQWEISPEFRSKITSFLIQEKYLDEQRYSRAFVNDKFKYQQWGRIKIAAMLRQKGISADTISEALSAIDEEAYKTLIKKLILEKLKKTTGKNEYEKRAKLLRYMAGKGFEPGLVIQYLN